MDQGRGEVDVKDGDEENHMDGKSDHKEGDHFHFEGQHWSGFVRNASGTSPYKSRKIISY